MKNICLLQTILDKKESSYDSTQIQNVMLSNHFEKKNYILFMNKKKINKACILLRGVFLLGFSHQLTDDIFQILSLHMGYLSIQISRMQNSLFLV